MRLQKMTAEDIRQKLNRSPKSTASYYGTIWPLCVEYIHFLPPFVKDTLARAYVSEGMLDKAIAAYEKMVKSPPASLDLGLIHPLTHYRLAQLYDRANRKKDAAAEYRRFLDLWKDADPGRIEIRDAGVAIARLK
jgi:pentatricopeptide repeat protein